MSAPSPSELFAEIRRWRRCVRETGRRCPPEERPATPTATAAREPEAAAVANGDWPLWAREVAKRRQAGDKGVGDTIERELGRGGETIKSWLKAIGVECGCARRKARYNRDYPYPA